MRKPNGAMLLRFHRFSVAAISVLGAGLWAGVLWGADGQVPLLISGIVGGVFAIGLLGVATVRTTDHPPNG